MNTVRAKLFCATVEQYAPTTLKVVMYARYSNNPEDNSFAEATPAANLELFVDNPSAQPFFVEGQTYYLDFTKAE
jgi:hypothetical protein